MMSGAATNCQRCKILCIRYRRWLFSQSVLWHLHFIWSFPHHKEAMGLFKVGNSGIAMQDCNSWLEIRGNIYEYPLNGHYSHLQSVNTGITTNTNGSAENKSWSTLDGLNDSLLKCIAPVNCWFNTQHYHIGRQQIINTGSTSPTTLYFRDQIHQSSIKQGSH